MRFDIAGCKALLMLAFLLLKKVDELRDGKADDQNAYQHSANENDTRDDMPEQRNPSPSDACADVSAVIN